MVIERCIVTQQTLSFPKKKKWPGKLHFILKFQKMFS